MFLGIESFNGGIFNRPLVTINEVCSKVKKLLLCGRMEL